MPEVWKKSLCKSVFVIDKEDMKARVKATGALLEVRLQDIDTEYPYICDMQGECGTLWRESELEFLDDDIDYWTRLEHQYAGLALSRLVELVNPGYEYVYEEVAILATNFAHALVEKMKNQSV